MTHETKRIQKQSNKEGYAHLTAEISRLRALCYELAEVVDDATKTAEFEKHPFRAWHAKARAALSKYREGRK